MDVLFQFYLWDQSHVTIVWNTRETGDIYKITGSLFGACENIYPSKPWCFQMVPDFLYYFFVQ